MAIASGRDNRIFKKAERDLRKLREGCQPDVVHSFRTTTRRLQVLLEELTPARDRKQKKLLKILGRIRRRAGRIRDIDVQLAALRSLRVPLEPRRKTHLTQRLLEIRQKHERKLRKLLKKHKFAEVSRRLRKASRTVNFSNEIDALEIARKTLASAAHSNARMDEDGLHRYRIAVKRARYAAEFSPKSSQSAQFIAELKTLQDVLGRWHDWFTLTQTATQQLGDIHQSSLVAALHNVTRGKFRQAVAQLSALPASPGSLTLVPSRKQTSKSSEALPQRGTAA